MTVFAIFALGFVLGLKHATDSDHVIAVTTIVSRVRSASAALRVGAWWGLGHGVTLLVVGGAIALFGLVIPPRLGLSLEMSVALMLIVLGAMNLGGAFKQLDRVAHSHDLGLVMEEGLAHLHPRGRLRALFIGVVHGLSGSAAVALLVLATIQSASLALLYLAIFGAGTLLGMMLLTLAFAFPIAALTNRFGNVERGLARVTGLVSVAFGLFLAYRVGLVDGLLLGAAHWVPR